jgi:hypothetical protein
MIAVRLVTRADAGTRLSGESDMAYRITKEYVCGSAIEDRPDALAEKLRALAEGGLDLEMIVSRRDQAGWALMFVSPLRTLEEIELAEQAGLRKEGTMQTLRIQGPNVPGLGARITTALAKASINLRGYWAAAIGGQCVTSIAFDSNEDQAKAKTILERELAS